MKTTYTPKVSVIMPSYNAGNALLLAVQSICQQSLQEWELILLDDGSSDGSVEKIKNLFDNRIRIFKNEINKGLSYRLNQGIFLCKSQYIARMDADDISFTRRLEVQFNFLEKNKDIDLISSKTLVFNSYNYQPLGLLTYKKNHNSIVGMPWKSIPMPHPTWMGRTEWFKKYLYKIPEVLRAEDQELLLRSMTDSKFYSYPEVLLGYRQYSFNFKKILVARISLLKTQIYYFINRKFFFYLLASIIIFSLNLFIDIILKLLRVPRKFFLQKIHMPSDSIRTEFASLITILKKKSVGLE